MADDVRFDPGKGLAASAIGAALLCMALAAAISVGSLLSGAIGVTTLGTAGGAFAGGGLCGLLYVLCKIIQFAPARDGDQGGASGMSETLSIRASVIGIIVSIAVGATGLGVASYIYVAKAVAQQRETLALLRESQIGDLQAQRHVLDTLIALQKDVATLQDRVFALEREHEKGKM